MSKASEILFDLLYLPVPNSWRKKPGAVIEALSKETREELKKLTSDDVKNIRPPDYYDH